MYNLGGMHGGSVLPSQNEMEASVGYRTVPKSSRVSRPEPGGSGQNWKRGRLRTWMALLATAALSVGGSMTFAQAANAAPADPVVFADENLENQVNDELGQSHGDEITEAQAATILNLDAGSAGISDLTGIEYLTNLNLLDISENSITDISALSGLTSLGTLSLNNNDVTDLSALAGLTNLVALYLPGNSVTDVSSLSGLTNLNHLNLWSNDITDISALAGLTNLTFLNLGGNSITDVSALSGLASQPSVDLRDQIVDLPSAAADTSTVNPVIDVAGAAVAISSPDADFAFDSGTNSWMFTVPGTKSMLWNTTVTVGGASGVEFSGTIGQQITRAHAVPVAPDVIQATCVDGDVVYPQVILADTTGITYAIVGTVAPGETIIVEAVLADDDHVIYVDPASGWVDESGDHIYATLEIVLDDPECEQVTPAPVVIDAPNGDLPVNDPCGPDNATWVLPTGADAPEGFTWRVAEGGLLVAEANDGFQFSDPSGELDPLIREYGHAPDTGEMCASAAGTTSTPVKLAATGGSSSTLGGAVAVALMGAGIFLLARRRRSVS